MQSPPPLAKAVGEAFVKHEKQLRKPLPNSYFFPNFGMNFPTDQASQASQASAESILTEKQRRERYYQPSKHNKRKLYAEFIFEKTGVSPLSSPHIEKPLPKRVKKQSSKRILKLKFHPSLLYNKPLKWNPYSSAFLRYGTILITVPEAEPFIYPQNLTSGFWTKFDSTPILDIKRKRNHFGKRALPLLTDGGNSKKRKKAGSAGKRGFVCPIENCLAPEPSTGRYSLTSSSNWVDHVFGEHGGGFPYNGKIYKKLIYMGEAILDNENMLACQIGDCKDSDHSFRNFSKLGHHIKTNHASVLSDLIPNNLWKKNNLKVKPISQLDNSSAGKRYHSRFGTGYVCPYHKDTKLKQTPESLARHWFFEHMKLSYFCPVRSCVAEKVMFAEPLELYKHMESHGALDPRLLNFSQLGALKR